MPTLWTQGEGRCIQTERTESVRMIFRGSRDGMWWRIGSAVLETRCGDAKGASTGVYKETKAHQAALGVGGVHSTA